MSYEEVDLIQRYRPQAQVAVVSNVHLVEGPPKTSCHGRSGLLFVGNMNHLPNRQAQLWQKETRTNLVGSDFVSNTIKRTAAELQ